MKRKKRASSALMQAWHIFHFPLLGLLWKASPNKILRSHRVRLHYFYILYLNIRTDLVGRNLGMFLFFSSVVVILTPETKHFLCFIHSIFDHILIYSIDSDRTLAQAVLKQSLKPEYTKAGGEKWNKIMSKHNPCPIKQQQPEQIKRR